VKGKDAASTPRSFYYLGAAAVAFLVGAGGWISGQDGASFQIELLKQQNGELIKQFEARRTDLDQVKEALAQAQSVTAMLMLAMN